MGEEKRKANILLPGQARKTVSLHAGHDTLILDVTTNNSLNYIIPPAPGIYSNKKDQARIRIKHTSLLFMFRFKIHNANWVLGIFYFTLR